MCLTFWAACVNFNPRPPRGGRPNSANPNTLFFVFQPTPSSRRATDQIGSAEKTIAISTHALLAEGDLEQLLTDAQLAISTHALLAEGDLRGAQVERAGAISTHALLAEGDSVGDAAGAHNGISTHALLAEGDRARRWVPLVSWHFNPRPPRGGRRRG